MKSGVGLLDTLDQFADGTKERKQNLAIENSSRLKNELGIFFLSC